ncbi:DUF6783 domain-containing protein, partial [uncultured Robinsoniella sp.]|uniref:DUF6783 domain-containing protein n=1 Tax=uncultured Robinsoniella sp. TaxID=904190 RepID=UPI00374EE6CD
TNWDAQLPESNFKTRSSVIPGHLGNGCHPLLLVLQQCLIKVFKLLGRKYPDMMVCINCIGEKSTKSIIV